VHTRHCWGNPEVKSLNVHGRIILILSSRRWMGDMDWVDLVQDRDWWLAAMNLQVP